MPSNPVRSMVLRAARVGRLLPFLLTSSGAVLWAGVARAENPAPTNVRSRQVELHYRIMDAPASAKVRLWYTRDRGATWQPHETSDATANPLLFTAPAEGLYGFLLVLSDDSTLPPAPGTPPQRWVFIDATPPLAQWDGVEPGDDFGRRRQLQLRWTAYDDHLTTRPVALAVQSSVDGTWQPIDSQLPNTGRLDWTVPPELSGQLSLKLVVSDQGGHSVERVYGPVPIDRWLRSATPATRPSLAASPPPPQASPATQPGWPDMERRLKAQDLLRQGEWSVQRGQHAAAVERFREALEADPDLLPALSNLANIHYLQQDYAKAVELYGSVLARDAGNLAALRGAALAHVSLKQYPQSRDMLQRLLAVSERDAQAWLDLGDVLFMMGDPGQARSHWNRALTADAGAEAVVRKAKRRLELYGTTVSDSGAAGPR